MNLIKIIFSRSSQIFDFLDEKWESLKWQKILGTILVLGFIFSLIIIEVNRQGWLPNFIAEYIPVKHLVAIESAFMLLLTYEVITLIFSLANSMSTSIGKQFEVLSLFLLRNIFKEFSHFSEPLTWAEIEPSIPAIIASSLGSLAIFVILIFYYKIQRHFQITSDNIDRSYYIASKKVISLLLFGSFLYILGFNLFSYYMYGYSETTFETFYTILVFTDVLIVLLSLRYSSSYQLAFRNSGFAVATVMIRVSLIAPLMMSALIGVGTAIFALGVSYAYNVAISAKTAKARGT